MPMEWLPDDLLTNGQPSPASQPSSPIQTLPVQAGRLGSVLIPEDRCDVARTPDDQSGACSNTNQTSACGKRSVKNSRKGYQLASEKSCLSKCSNLVNNSRICGLDFKNHVKKLHAEDGYVKQEGHKSPEANRDSPQSGRADVCYPELTKMVTENTPDPATSGSDGHKGSLTVTGRSGGVSEPCGDGEETSAPTQRAAFGVGGPCHVCGERASGNFFGALVCLPCKSFFIRCTKEGEPVFVSQCDGRCDVSKQGRNRCQHCRYEKCIAAGMSRKEKPEAIEPGEGQLLCRVCGDIANGIHFGVYTCEGCKKFFRRGLLEYQSYVCKGAMSCVLNPRNRNNCRYCRYQKCLNVGMSRGAIKMGRPKKLVRDQDLSSAVFTRDTHRCDQENGEGGISDPVSFPVPKHRFHTSENEYRESAALNLRHVSLSSESDCSVGEETKSESSDEWTYSENPRSVLPIKKCILRSLLTKEEAALICAAAENDLDDGGPSSQEDNACDSVFSRPKLSPFQESSLSQIPETVVTGSDRDTEDICVGNRDHCTNRDITPKRSLKDTLKIPTNDSTPDRQHLHMSPRYGSQRSKSNSPISPRMFRSHDVQGEPSKSKRRKSDNDSPSIPCSQENTFADTFFPESNQKTQKCSEHSVLPRKRAAGDLNQTPVFYFPSRNVAVKPLDLSWSDANSQHTTRDCGPVCGFSNPVTCFPVRTDPLGSRTDLRGSRTDIRGSSKPYHSNAGLRGNQSRASTFMPGNRYNHSIISHPRDSWKGETNELQKSPGTSRFNHTHSYTQMDPTKQSVLKQSPTSGLFEVPPQPIVIGPSPITLPTNSDSGKGIPGKAQQDKSLMISAEVLNQVDDFFLSSLSLLKRVQQRLDKPHQRLQHQDMDMNERFKVSQLPTHPSDSQDSFPHTGSGTDYKPETDTSRHGVHSRGMPPFLVLPEERNTADKMESVYRFPPVQVCQYWNKMKPPPKTIQMNSEQHQVLQDMLEAYMEMLKNLNECHIPPKESFSNIKSWPKDETAPIVEHVVRRILRQLKEELTFMSKVPGFNDFHPQDRMFIIHNICFANVTLMAARDWYDPETQTFQNMMTWELPEDHPMYKFRQNAKTLSDLVCQLKMDRTEAAMMSALNVAAADILDLEGPDVIERSRDFLITALTTHLSYKGVDPVPRMKQLFSLMPAFRLCGFWTKKLREEIALNRSGASDKHVNVERLMQENPNRPRDQTT